MQPEHLSAFGALGTAGTNEGDQRLETGAPLALAAILLLVRGGILWSAILKRSRASTSRRSG
ncbi:hypothetical protein VK92_18635 [Burkholderia sp. LK4]|nr:hypothetical protein VL00_00315 [Burkholderia cepacia]KMN58991.1 hypothetical protein VK92_18635 [Burkholderia sp. LK4]